MLYGVRKHSNRFYCNNSLRSTLNKPQKRQPSKGQDKFLHMRKFLTLTDPFILPILLPFTVYWLLLPIQVTVVFKIFLTPFALDVFDNMILQEFF